MKCFVVISIACFLHVASSYDHVLIDPSAKVPDLERIGNSAKIFENVVIGENSRIGAASTIHQNVKIGEGTTIGSACNINQETVIGDAVLIEDHVDIGDNSFIGNNCQIWDETKLSSHINIENNCNIRDSVTLDDHVSIGPNNFIDQHVSISRYVNTDNGCILDLHSKIDSYSSLGENIYLGEYAKIGMSARVEANAVIHLLASVPYNGKVEKNDVIIKTPTSADFYMNSILFDYISKEHIERMKEYASESISIEFNSFIRQLLNDLMKKLNEHSKYMKIADFEDFRMIKSLYLMQYHGIDNFKVNKKNQLNHRLLPIEDGPLAHEYHFVSDAPKNILERDNRDLMVKLLALEQDVQRVHRVSGDVVGKMFFDIQTGQRNVKCDQEIEEQNPYPCPM